MSPPIREEERDRYPADWPHISWRINLRSGHACECRGECGHDHTGWSGQCGARNGRSHPVTGSRVVLTVAHMDHQPEHCDDDNLRAMCQRCHLAYDRHHHRQTRRSRKAMRDFFEEQST